MKNYILKAYDVSGRVLMTTEARNAGAIGRKYWWIYLGTVNALSKHHACAKLRKQGVHSIVDKLKAYSR